MLRLLNIYTNVVLLIQSSRYSNFSNKKLGIQFWQGDAMQVAILPKSVIHKGAEVFSSGKGSFTEPQRIACSDTCEHRVSALGGRGSCYVNHDVRHAAANAYSIFSAMVSLPGLDHEINPMIPRFPINGFIRVSTWGDVSKLPEQAQLDLLNLVKRCTKHTAYISGFRIVDQQWRSHAMASCTTRDDVLDALHLGWNVYASSKVAQDTLREHLDNPVFACPFTEKNLARVNGSKRLMTMVYGCHNCKIPCNGTRSITSDKIPF